MSRPTSPTAAMVSTGAVSTVNGIVSTNYVSNSVDSQRLVRHDGNQVRLAVRTQNGHVTKRPRRRRCVHLW